MRWRHALAVPLALALACPASAQQDLTTLPPAQNGFKPKTTAWGEPDFTGGWPIDIRDHAQRLAAGAFAGESE